eukprot:jgi/Psemu1/301645/fgenesh1_kg.41_\
MLTALGSMLLVVILSTICMNDIAICPSRLSENAYDYIRDNYSLEWFTVKSHFYYGALSFVMGAAFRAYVSISCPVIGRGIVGILSGLTLVSLSNLVEKSKNQGGGSSIRKAFIQHLTEMLAMAKSNIFYAAGLIIWGTSIAYLLVKLPHMYRYLSMM